MTAASRPDPYAAEKARYQELYQKGKAARRDFSEVKRNPAQIDEALIVSRETVPGGWGHSVHLSPGQTLRLINKTKTKGVSLQIFNAHDRSERFNAGDTVKLQWSARLHHGKLLYSDMGRVLASISDDRFGRHDALTGGSTAQTNETKYGDKALRSTRGNFILLASKHGLSRADIAPCLTLFAPVIVDDKGVLVWEGPEAAAGDYVDLRAEMDILVFVSNCPHPLSPGGFDPEPIEALVWRSGDVPADDFCRTSCEEARRGFDNNEALLATGGVK
ncbi:MAG: DUF1989 domain-containing protein [Rhizobiales bacterium]|nr:DUF1989 domain-containing protein [Hyphomicrobiales bacterium]